MSRVSVYTRRYQIKLEIQGSKMSKSLKHIANCIHPYLPTHPKTCWISLSVLCFMFFFRKKPLKNDNLTVQTCHLHSTTFCRLKFAWGSPLTSTLRRFPEEMGGPGTIAASMCHIFAFFKGIKQDYTYSLYRYIQKMFCLGDQERSIKYATVMLPFKITRVFTLPIWVWANHPKLPYILHLYGLIPPQ